MDQLKNNAVSITMGADAVQFIKQPDGTYTAPAGISMTLTKPSGSGYQLQQQQTVLQQQTLTGQPQTGALDQRSLYISVAYRMRF